MRIYIFALILFLTVIVITTIYNSIAFCFTFFKFIYFSRHITKHISQVLMVFHWAYITGLLTSSTLRLLGGPLCYEPIRLAHNHVTNQRNVHFLVPYQFPE